MRFPKLKKVILVIVAVEVIYLLASNYLLWNGRIFAWIFDKGDTLSITYDSGWSPLPGVVLTRNLKISDHDSDVAWKFHGERVYVWIELFSLILEDLHILAASSSGVDFTLEFVEPNKSPAPPDPNKPKKPPKPPEWSLYLSALTFRHFKTLKIADVAVEGDFRIDGDFVIWPKTGNPKDIFEVKRSRVSFSSHDQLQLKNIPALEQLSGQFSVHTPAFDPGNVDLTKFLKAVGGSMDFLAQMHDLSSLKLYFGELEGVNLGGGTGTLKIKNQFEQGRFAVGSIFETSLQQLEFSILRHRFKGNGGLHLEIFERQPGHLTSELTLALPEFQAEARQNKALLIGKNFNFTAVSDQVDMLQFHPDVEARLHIDQMLIPDASIYSDYLPKTFPLKISTGRGEVKIDVSASTQAKSSPGKIDVHIKNGEVQFHQLRYLGDFKFTAAIDKADLRKTHFHSPSAALDLSQVRVLEINKQGRPTTKARATEVEDLKDPWWARFKYQDLEIDLEKNLNFSTHFDMQMKDSLPLVRFLKEAQKVPALARRFLKTTEIQMQGSAALTDSKFELEQVSFDSKDYHAEGRYQEANDRSDGIFLIKTPWINLGLAIRQDKTEFKILNVEKWYKNHLKDFAPGKR